MTEAAVNSAPLPKRPLLKVENLKTYLYLNRGLFARVDGADLEVADGETLGIVGESGSGKTMTSLPMLRLCRSRAVASSRDPSRWTAPIW